MAFNPLEEKGLALDDQIRSWLEANVEPFDPDTVHPYTRCRVIVMNGIEVEGVLFIHPSARTPTRGCSGSWRIPVRRPSAAEGRELAARRAGGRWGRRSPTNRW